MNETRWAIGGGIIGLFVTLAVIWGLGAVTAWDVAWPALLGTWAGADRLMFVMVPVVIPCFFGTSFGSIVGLAIYEKK